MFKCKLCERSFKKEITLSKHITGEGQVGFVFAVRPGRQKKAKEMREEWRNDKMDGKTTKKIIRN